MKKITIILLIQLAFLSIGCDEGDTNQQFTPEERIVKTSIVTPNIDNIKFGDQVEILATLTVNVRPVEPAKITFISEKGDLTYKGEIINSGENVNIDTTQEIKFIYIPKDTTDPIFKNQPHNITVLMTGCENGRYVRPNCSVDFVQFEITN